MARVYLSFLVFTIPVLSWQTLAVSSSLLPQSKTMFGTILGTLSILIITAFSATVPQPSQNSIVLPDASAVDSPPLILGNASSNDSASGNDLAITCEYRLGSGFKVTSCSNLFPLLRQGTDDWVFAERFSPLPHDVGLPFRIQSRKFLNAKPDVKRCLTESCS